MEALQSADGTPLVFQRSGEGPAVVLVAGAFGDRTSTAGLAPLLARNYTVYEYDRRGRGSSGSSPGYSIEREVDDLAAVIAAAGGSAYVFGNGAGGCLALEAAARGVPVTKLAVWEPPYTADHFGDGGVTSLLEDVEEAVVAGDNARAAERFLRSITPPEEVAALKAGPGWPRLRDLAPTLVHDLVLSNHGFVPTERLARVSCTTEAFTGELSAEWAGRATRLVAGAIPDADQVVVDGQGHVPLDGVLAALLTEFFRG